MALYQFNGKTASFLFLNGRVIKNWMPLKMSYTIEDPIELHTFNSGFNYEMEVYENDSGTYTVNIYSEDDFTSFRCNTNTLTVDYLEVTNRVSSMQRMFNNCEKLTKINTTNWDTSNIYSMYCMFDGCKSLTSLDVSKWDTSNITDMSCMFQYCTSLTSLDVSNWDTSNVTNMMIMFNLCNSLASLDLSKWDVSKVVRMDYMFSQCKLLRTLDLTGWDTSNVIDMSSMFDQCVLLENIYGLSNFNTSNVTNMSGMFFNFRKSLVDAHTLNLTNFDTSKVEDMSYMFYNCRALFNLSTWDTSSVTNAASMFESVRDISWYYDGYNYQNWTLTEEQTGFSGKFPWNMFCTITVNYIDDNNVEITSPYVTTVKYKNTYDVSSKSNIKFYGYIYLDTNGIIKGTATGDRTINVLYENRNYVEYTVDYGKIGNVNISYNTGSDEDGYTHYYFLPSRVNIRYVLLTLTDGTTSKSVYTRVDRVEKIRCYYINSAESFSFKNSKVKDILSLGTIRLTTTKEMFYGCKSLTSLDLSNFDTSKVTDTSYMFCYCESLTSLDLSSFDTSNVTDMSHMFRDCTSLKSLDLSNFNTSKVTNMSFMFSDCESLKSLDLSNFNTSKVTSIISMFYSIPVTVDWHYDGTNYTNWTITESYTGYDGTFPWNK